MGEAGVDVFMEVHVNALRPASRIKLQLQRCISPRLREMDSSSPSASPSVTMAVPP